MRLSIAQNLVEVATQAAQDANAATLVKLKGLYEFHFTFPKGPTFTDHFRIDRLTRISEKQGVSTYRVRGA